MHATLPDFSAVRVLVAGDVMLDQYWSGETCRISPEAPVPVVAVAGEELRIGGAGNVAANAAALGAQTALLAPVGPDASGRTLTRLLRRHGIENLLLTQRGLATPKKLRVVSQRQQLIRLDFEKRTEINAPVLQRKFRAALKACDVVVLSDYGKGALADPQPLIRLARQAGKPVFVDPKRTDFAPYAGATALTPNRAELEAVAGPAAALKDVAAHAERLCRKHRLQAMLVTLSERGMLLQQKRRSLHLKAVAREVYDVTGAGDTVAATFACAHAAGLAFEEATRLANVAAGLVVGRFGTASVTPGELAQAVHAQRQPETGIVSTRALQQLAQIARESGETLVFTNGCFDILHAGHVALLEQAARLGDRLIVAVNSDASVRRNKGPDRPVQPLKHRQQLLAGLECVDWVVSFSQTTPEKLIRDLRPDVLVKGADYKPADIAGGEAVERTGGKVVVLPLMEGQSSTELIRRIRQRDE